MRRSRQKESIGKISTRFPVSRIIRAPLVHFFIFSSEPCTFFHADDGPCALGTAPGRALLAACDTRVHSRVYPTLRSACRRPWFTPSGKSRPPRRPALARRLSAAKLALSRLPLWASAHALRRTHAAYRSRPPRPLRSAIRSRAAPHSMRLSRSRPSSGRTPRGPSSNATPPRTGA